MVLYPSPYLKDGVRLVDTPGVGSVYIHNTDVAYRYLPKSDAALFLLSVDQPASSAEIEFLKDVREYAGRIFFLLNKIDYLSEEETGRALSFAKETLEAIMEPDVRIFPISAKLALQAKLEGSPETLAASGLPDFSEALDRFLVKEKGKVLLESVSKNLQKILSRERLETELELKSLETPVEQIREKIAAFERRKEELIEERRTFDVLFSSEIERLITKDLDTTIGELKSRLASEMAEEFNRFYESKKDLSLKELNDALEQFVLEKIQSEFTAWRELEDERLSNSFDSICSRFAAKVNGVTDSLLDFSSQLFCVPFEAVEAESIRASESSFHYKLRGDAVGLDMLSDSLTQVIPKYISGKWKFQRSQRLGRSDRQQGYSQQEKTAYAGNDRDAGRKAEVRFHRQAQPQRIPLPVADNRKYGRRIRRNIPGNRKRHGLAPQGRRRSSPKTVPPGRTARGNGAYKGGAFANSGGD